MESLGPAGRRGKGTPPSQQDGRRREEEPLRDLRTLSRGQNLQDYESRENRRDVSAQRDTGLRSIQANLMIMNGRSGKNGGFPLFDGTCKGYPRFKRRWAIFQAVYYSLTPQRQLASLFRETGWTRRWPTG
jgi:hypothetical protein